ncbi:hypothetical protein [Curtobacterium sp. 9128]|uniref:hypothetical protein n=1 Tax=Curtobacterium sp. 9128 TaxID=1793722 RepID=UPI0011A4AE65|nr:hypothetical protein [Curtobacterium sp. 9128]
MSTRSVRRAVLVSGVANVVTWGALVVLLGGSFLSVSEQAHDATADASFRATVLGLPLFESFRTSGRQGVHVLWGTVVALGITFAVSTALTIGCFILPRARR